MIFKKYHYLNIKNTKFNDLRMNFVFKGEKHLIEAISILNGGGHWAIENIINKDISARKYLNIVKNYKEIKKINFDDILFTKENIINRIKKNNIDIFNIVVEKDFKTNINNQNYKHRLMLSPFSGNAYKKDQLIHDYDNYSDLYNDVKIAYDSRMFEVFIKVNANELTVDEYINLINLNIYQKPMKKEQRFYTTRELVDYINSVQSLELIDNIAKDNFY
jgi:hypothetical protein